MTTVRDFGQVFDAYAQFEESMINAKMETTAELGPSEEGKRKRLISYVSNESHYRGCRSGTETGSF